MKAGQTKLRPSEDTGPWSAGVVEGRTEDTGNDAAAQARNEGNLVRLKEEEL